MNKTQLSSIIETEINALAQRIIDKKNISDEVAHGKIGFYLALRRALNEKAYPEDIGLLDAINDTLQAVGVIEKNMTFLSGIEK